MGKIINHGQLSNPNMHLVTWDMRRLDDYGLLLAR